MEHVLSTHVGGDRCVRTGRSGSVAATALMVLCLVAGAALLLYPAIATYVNETSLSQAVSHYEQQVASYSEEERAALLAEAHAYNDSLAGIPVRDPFVEGSGTALPDNYSEVLNPEGTGVMGMVTIPAIGVKLPIYHGATDEILQKGAGHVPQTSFPVGGEGTHAVITGHTGLPDKVMFTNLTRLAEGDVFIVEVLGENRAYRVDETSVVEPEDLSAIAIEPGREYVTLLTCTPYGINSHRLLVRGVPCPMPTDDQIVADTRPMPWGTLLVLVCLFVAGCTAFALVSRKRKKELASLEVMV